MIVFDLDGTLTDDAHRHQFLIVKDFDSYNDRCALDLPRRPVLRCMRALHLAGEIVQIWTGRPERCRKATELWLMRHATWFMSFGSHLRMRPDGDQRSSAVLKEEWLDAAEKLSRPAVTMAFDDLQVAVDMWRRRGVLCAQVAINARDYNAPTLEVVR